MKKHNTSRKRTPQEKINKIIELSKDYNIQQIAEMVGVTEYVVQHAQKRNRLVDVKRKNRRLKNADTSNSEFFDVDQYRREYLY